MRPLLERVVRNGSIGYLDAAATGQKPTILHAFRITRYATAFQHYDSSVDPD
ncbi:MAG TPA: hypothetical protein VFA90_20075 [Terriglobales bacterium]|nr:hypothetical protein [Terriglobales bacterium]